MKESFKIHISDPKYHQVTIYPHQIALIRLNKPLNNNNLLSTIILNKSIMWNKKEVRIIILFSCIDSHHYIYNTLNDTLINLTSHQDNLYELMNHSSYAHFIHTILKYQQVDNE